MTSRSEATALAKRAEKYLDNHPEASLDWTTLVDHFTTFAAREVERERRRRRATEARGKERGR